MGIKNLKHNLVFSTSAVLVFRVGVFSPWKPTDVMVTALFITVHITPQTKSQFLSSSSDLETTRLHHGTFNSFNPSVLTCINGSVEAIPIKYILSILAICFVEAVL